MSDGFDMCEKGELSYLLANRSLEYSHNETRLRDTGQRFRQPHQEFGHQGAVVVNIVIVIIIIIVTIISILLLIIIIDIIIIIIIISSSSSSSILLNIIINNIIIIIIIVININISLSPSSPSS